MHRSFAYILFVLLALVAGLGYSYHRQLERLDTQLAYSTAVLITENEQAIHTAHNNLQLIEVTVEKNRNQPADITRLQKAKALHRQITHALASLHDCAGTLYRLAGHATNTAEPRQPAYQPFINTASPIAQRWQELRLQLAACNDSLRQASPAAMLPATALPSVASTTTAMQALADLALAEHQLVTSETVILQNIDRALAQRKLLFKPLVLATAERTMVVSGDTYRARLLVATHGPSDLRMDMACNGRSVPIDSHAMGQVRFRAPLRPGPATWTGTIRLSNYGYYGRDSVFKVTVPYRVARR
jgi:hypothetical protein